MANNWLQHCKLIFRMHRLSHSAGIRYHLIQYFLYLSLCSAVITLMLLLLLLSEGRGGGIDGSWDVFSET